MKTNEDVKLPEDLEREFDKKFYNLHLVDNWNYQECQCDTKIDCGTQIKQFLSHVYQQGIKKGKNG